MDEDFDSDLQHQVFEITYRGMVDDFADFTGIAPEAARARGPRRFSSGVAVERTRTAIAHACRQAEASELVREFFTTHWLDRFAPRAM